MNFDLKFDDLGGQLQNAFAQLTERPVVRRQMLGAMAARFKFLVLLNLGATGLDRPKVWPLLSKRYAQRVGRTFATMELRGRLAQSIRVQVNDEYSEVSINPDDCVYAERHQWGDDKMPARPYFPMTQTALTPQAEAEVIRVAEDMLEQSLTGKYVGPVY